MQTRKVRLGRCWQGKGYYLIWEAQLEQGPKKLFLKLDTTQAGAGLSFITEKPADVLPSGGIAALVRKHLPSATVLDLIEVKTSGTIWILLSGQRYLVLHKAKPPVLELVDGNKTSLFRFGQKGTFTKIKTYEGELPNAENTEAFASIYSPLLASAGAKPAQANEQAPAKEPAQGVGTSFQSQVRKIVARRLKTAKAALEKDEKSLPSESALAELESKARSLQEFAYQLDPADRKEKMSEAFATVKKLKKQRALALPRLETTRTNVLKLEEALHLLRTHPLEDAAIEQLVASLNLPLSQPGGASPTKVATPRHQERLPYKRYQLADKSIILVGKSAQDNDLLTKQAKANDFWLHALNVEGSHVVVPVKNLSSKSLSPRVQKQAAILALHYSKMRDNYGGDVYLTTRQHLKKRPGMPPGKWQVGKAQTLYVTYSQEELKEVLSFLT